ncbi:tyrosine-type recombinase/integrase [Streptomyces lavendulocolor]|uniref:tyrosine-type recombinase/integrase n=1 Tax=Streptomyces lavendulocolor TaxID=67316 RepID=UPI003C2AFDE9
MTNTTLLAKVPAQSQVLTFHGSHYKALQHTYPPRSVPESWEESADGLHTVLDRLNELFKGASENKRYTRWRGARNVLRWLEQFDGDTWQQRWRNSSLERNFGAGLPELEAWVRQHLDRVQDGVLRSGILGLACADVIRPDPAWLLTRRSRHMRQIVAECRDPDGFAALEAQAAPGIWDAKLGLQARNQVATIILAKGGKVRDITVGDCIELRGIETRVMATGGGRSLFYLWLKELEVFPPDAPATLRDIKRRAGQVSVEELVDRYRLQCRPVRDLIVDYLTERQPSLDYTSLEGLSRNLAQLFWADLERHHQGIDSLRLTKQVATAWKERIRTKTRRKRQPDGGYIEITTERQSALSVLNTVRAFYLDISQWAVEEPGRWGAWVAPSPVKESELSYKKQARRQKAKSDQRTRERLPVLPVLVEAADRQLKEARTRHEAALAVAPGATFTVLGKTYTRIQHPRWADGVIANTAYDQEGRRCTFGYAENRAFWAWATVEFLRHTGVRIEEMLEVSHHSITQYTLPTTGEIVPLLQIAPSKTDKERLLLVSPELADVLSAIVCRVRDASGTVPLVRAYDVGEKVWNPPMPLLFQWRTGGQSRPISETTIRRALDETLDFASLTDNTGQPLDYQPHDFRRIFITDAILQGLPPHIAQVIAGHDDISTTMRYKAIYPMEAIEAHRAFIARRRGTRPSEEYRRPTDQEWDDFLGHFELRKLALGTCGRAFGTPCIHEHACIRCPMLRPDPGERRRLVEIAGNLADRIAEAQREGWLGDVKGLGATLEAAKDKIAQMDAQTASSRQSIYLGMPSFGEIAARTT